jgi:hypothetical protein
MTMTRIIEDESKRLHLQLRRRVIPKGLAPTAENIRITQEPARRTHRRGAG